MSNIEKPVYRFALREDLKDEKQFLPTRAEGKASGWDVRAAQKDREPIILQPFQHIMLPLGFRAFCPEGWWFRLSPRSSSFAKKNLHTLYGIIDEGYEGQCLYACQYIPSMRIFEKSDRDAKTNMQHLSGCIDTKSYQTLTINFGDALGQIIPVRRQEMDVVGISNEEYDELCKTRGGERGAGGFGSSDKERK